MRLGIFLPAAVLAGAASAGVGKMDAKPLWDLADHGGPRKVSAADPLEIPNAAIPNVRAFTFEATYRFDDLTEERYFTLAGKVMSEEGVTVIDTYGLLVNRLDLSRGDTLHWLDGGYELISDAIVREIGLEEAK